MEGGPPECLLSKEWKLTGIVMAPTRRIIKGKIWLVQGDTRVSIMGGVVEVVLNRGRASQPKNGETDIK